MKSLKTVQDLNLKRKRVLLRVAYDVSLVKKKGVWQVQQEARLKAILPTINYLLKQGCSIVLVSWLKRPGGKVVAKYSLAPVAARLSQMLGLKVKFVADCVGPKVKRRVGKLQPGQVLLLENTRFHPQEQANDPDFARQLASWGEVIVFDAFAQAHRQHASTTGLLAAAVELKKPIVVGFLFKEELSVLGQLVKNPMRPFVVLVGGSKVSDKLATFPYLLKQADLILVGGGVANAFLKAQKYQIGSSWLMADSLDKDMVMDDYLDQAKQYLKKSSRVKVDHQLWPSVWPDGRSHKLKQIQLPLDVVVARQLKPGKYDHNRLSLRKINGDLDLCQADEAILDIGPHTVKVFSQVLKAAKTIFWNGPVGLYEDFDFSHGSRELGWSIAGSKGFSVVGGGDTEGMISQFKLDDQFGHVSTGGGASLALLSGQELPVLKYLS